MKISIVGGGPIGGILAASLIKSGESVSIIDVQNDLLQKLSADGVKLINASIIDKDFADGYHKPVIATSDMATVASSDIVFVCVKGTVQEQVVASLKPFWRDGTTLISMQNGIDVEEVLAELAGRDNTLRIVVNFAGAMVEPAVYRVGWVKPPNQIGALTQKGAERAQLVCDILNKAKLATKVTSEIKKLVYEKTMLNAACCAVCTLTGSTMVGSIDCEPNKNLTVELLQEARTIGEKMGMHFERTIDDWLGYLKAGGSHRTSMAEDMMGGRRTEVMYMNGKIAEYGKRLGIPAPYHTAMMLAILGKEKFMGK